MSPAKMSKIEGAIRTVIDLNTAFNRHDIDAMMQLMCDDCQFESAGPAPDGTLYSGKESIIGHWLEFFNQHPNAHTEIEEIYGLGHRCIMHWKFKPSMGDDADYIRGVDVFRIQGGCILEMLTYRKA